MSGDLVIGYGSSIRGDDAVGQHVAETVETWGLPGVLVLARHQLTPDLAPTIAEAQRLFLIDARPDDGGEVRQEPLEPGEPTETVGHISSPTGLLSLTMALYGRIPPTWLISIPAPCMQIGMGLSEKARQGMARALDLLRSQLTRPP